MQGANELARTPRRLAPRLALAAILLLSAFLNLYRLNTIGINGIGNFYYAAAVQTMLSSWRHFSFLSTDPAGFVSLDKPPLAYWIQAASAKIFGFHGLSLLLPQALAGIVSVYVLYRLVRRSHGERPALLAALALAVTPISVVSQRNNTAEALLVLTLLLAAWAILRAVEESSRRWLFLGAALIGVGFNLKMLQLLLVAPALAALYLAASRWPWRKRLLNAGWAILLALCVSLPWVLAVELTPPGQRPYVGGSSHNSVFELIVGYNGLARLWSEDWSFYLGAPGPLRLFNDKLGGQASWLLPLVLVGLVAALWQLRRQPMSATEHSRRREALILWGTWTIFPLVYFSVSTFYHTYYLSLLAPAVAALAGISAEALWGAWRSKGWPRVLGVIALLVSAAVQALILLPYPGWSLWLIPPIAVLCLAASAILLVAWWGRWLSGTRWPAVAFTGGLLVLLIAPSVWTLIPVTTCVDYTMPYGGPQVIGPARDCKPLKPQPFLNRELVSFLEQNRAGARYLAASHDMGITALGVLETQEPFMSLGGYRGSDPILTVDEFAERVARGEVRFYLALSEEAEYPVQEDIRGWVKEHCPRASLEGITVWGPCEVPSP